MNGLQKSRLRKVLETGILESSMKKQDIYIEKILELLKDEPALVKSMIKRIK